MKKFIIFGAGLALGAIAGAVGTVLLGLKVAYEPDFYHDEPDFVPTPKPAPAVKPLHPCPICGIETQAADNGVRHCPKCGRDLDPIAMQFCKEDIEFSEQSGGKARLCGACGKRLLRPNDEKPDTLTCPGCGHEEPIGAAPEPADSTTPESVAKTMKQRREKKLAEKKAKNPADEAPESPAAETANENAAEVATEITPIAATKDD